MSNASPTQTELLTASNEALTKDVGELKQLLTIGDKEAAKLRDQLATLQKAADNRSQLSTDNGSKLTAATTENGQLKGKLTELSDRIVDLEKQVGEREAEIKRLNTVIGASKVTGMKDLPSNMYCLCESVIATVLVNDVPTAGDLRKDDIVGVFSTTDDLKRAQVQLPNSRVYRVLQPIIDELQLLGHLYG